MEEREVIYSDVHWIANKLCKESEVVSNLEKLGGGLSLIPAQIHEIMQRGRIDGIRHYNVLCNMVTSWISSSSTFERTFQKFVRILRDLDLNSAADTIVAESVILEAQPRTTNSSQFNPFQNYFWFDVPEKIHTFTGREEQLKELHNNIIQQNYEMVTVITTLCGLGGIGKTALSTHYAWSKYKVFYTNIIWINSETEANVSDSFNRLAEKLKIHTVNSNGISLNLRDIVSCVYDHFIGSPTLFIFDNVEKDDDINHYIPTKSPDNSSTYILITSRNQTWNEKTNLIVLDVFTIDQSVQFLTSYLKLSDDAEITCARNISLELENLPLAIKQAGAYIKMQCKHDSKYKCDKMKSYIDLLKENPNSVLNFPYSKQMGDKYQNTVSTTWDITMSKIKQIDPLAFEILKICSFFNSDNIPFQLFINIESLNGSYIQQPNSASNVLVWLPLRLSKFFNDETSNRYVKQKSNSTSDASPHLLNLDFIKKAIHLLAEFSMVTINDNKLAFNVHRLVQTVTRAKSESDNGILNDAIMLIEFAMKFENYDEYEELCLIHSQVISNYIRMKGLERYYQRYFDLMNTKINNSLIYHKKHLELLFKVGVIGEAFKKFKKSTIGLRGKQNFFREKWIIMFSDVIRNVVKKLNYKIGLIFFKHISSFIRESIGLSDMTTNMFNKVGTLVNTMISTLCTKYPDNTNEHLNEVIIIYNMCLEHPNMDSSDLESKDIIRLALRLKNYDKIKHFIENHVKLFLSSTVSVYHKQNILKLISEAVDVLIENYSFHKNFEMDEFLCYNYKCLLTFITDNSNQANYLYFSELLMKGILRFGKTNDILIQFENFKLLFNNSAKSDLSTVDMKVLKFKNYSVYTKNIGTQILLFETSLSIYKYIFQLSLDTSNFDRISEATAGILEGLTKSGKISDIIPFINIFTNLSPNLAKRVSYDYILNVAKLIGIKFFHPSCLNIKQAMWKESETIFQALFDYYKDVGDISKISYITEQYCYQMAYQSLTQNILILSKNYIHILRTTYGWTKTIYDTQEAIQACTGTLYRVSMFTQHFNKKNDLIECVYNIYKFLDKKLNCSGEEIKVRIIFCLCEMGKISEIINLTKKSIRKMNIGYEDSIVYIALKMIAKHHNCVFFKDQILKEMLIVFKTEYNRIYGDKNNKTNDIYSDSSSVSQKYVDEESIHLAIRMLYLLVELNDWDSVLKTILELRNFKYNILEITALANSLVKIAKSKHITHTKTIYEHALAFYINASNNKTDSEYETNFCVVTSGIVTCLTQLDRPNEIYNHINNFKIELDILLTTYDNKSIDDDVFIVPDTIYFCGLDLAEVFKSKLIEENLFILQSIYNHQKKVYYRFVDMQLTVKRIIRLFIDLDKFEEIQLLYADFEKTLIDSCDLDIILASILELAQFILSNGRQKSNPITKKYLILLSESISKKWYVITLENRGYETYFTLEFLSIIITCEALLLNRSDRILNHSKLVYRIALEKPKKPRYRRILYKISVELKQMGYPNEALVYFEFIYLGQRNCIDIPLYILYDADGDYSELVNIFITLGETQKQIGSNKDALNIFEQAKFLTELQQYKLLGLKYSTYGYDYNAYYSCEHIHMEYIQRQISLLKKFV